MKTLYRFVMTMLRRIGFPVRRYTRPTGDPARKKYIRSALEHANRKKLIDT